VTTTDTTHMRDTVRARLIAQAGFQGATEHPLPGDASTRRYIRLRRPDGATAMLMDAPPSAESAPCDPSWDRDRRIAEGYNAQARLAASRVEAFVGFARHLNAAGLSAPRVMSWDRPAGLAVLEDLGDAVYADVLADGAPEADLYATAIAALASLHRHAAPPELEHEGGAWPLLGYDRTALHAEVALMTDWFGARLLGREVGDSARADFHAAWDAAFDRLDGEEPVMVLRDYHAQNLIWLPDRAGAARTGLLDFQDGLAGHRAYDLVSLLEDARRDVAPALATDMIAVYEAEAGIADSARFRAAYAVLGAQRNAKIVGIFARLAIRDGKQRYLALLPRVTGLLRRNLLHPALGAVSAWVARHLPVDSWESGQ